MTRTVKIESKSRNVKGYIRVYLQVKDLERKLNRAKQELGHKRNHLNGTQWGEAQRIVRELLGQDVTD